jgi:hypothetical protein
VFAVTFSGAGVGGNVEAIDVVASFQSLTGTGSALTVYADESVPFTTTEDSTVYTPVTGAELTGTFSLTLRGHTTEPIPFNADDTTVISRLEALDNIGTVDVNRDAATEELGYTWSVTFLSNPGYFPVESRNVDDMSVNFENLGTTNSGTTSTAVVNNVADGTDPLSGTFTLSYQDASGTTTTNNINNFASAEDVKSEL